ncbi:MAG: Asp-tRNA(Asn)/Glu-tRNA(Gln) amidotransferase GatCAB subunit B, partial [Chloroflexi bacterium]|nr:Asp-tRNA(Asn)/Glu-tRNA(Gln) amidotransferase GatCAB subunit B [Chloroflexota bacterium]
GQRTKEHAHDYRYFPEPDLPPLVISREWVEEIRARMPELPDEKAARYRQELGLSAYDAFQLVSDRAMAEYFEEALRLAGTNGRAKGLANWIINDINAVLNARGIGIEALPVTPAQLNELLDLIEQGTLSVKIAREVFVQMVETGQSASAIVREQGLAQISDDRVVLEAIEQAIAENPKAVADYQAGKTAALDFLFGKVMKATRGQANPQVTRRLLGEKLGAR